MHTVQIYRDRQAYSTEIQKQTVIQYRDIETDRYTVQINRDRQSYSTEIKKQTGIQYRDTEANRKSMQQDIFCTAAINTDSLYIHIKMQSNEVLYYSIYEYST